jgi:hypothetical protein
VDGAHHWEVLDLHTDVGDPLRVPMSQVRPSSTAYRRAVSAVIDPIESYVIP